MILDRRPWDTTLGLFLLDLVDRLYDEGAQQSLITRCQIAGVNVHESVYFAATASRPAWFWCVTDDGHSLFVGGGTENYEQGKALLDSYTNTNRAPLGSVNNYLATIANEIVNATGFADFLTSPTMVFGGHSLGGALALVVAAICRISRPEADISCTTFGAPRSGGIGWRALNQLSEVKRWMNDNDPVPLVPPTISQCPPLAVVYSAEELRVFADQQHIVGGEEIHPDGSTDAVILPSVASISPTTDLASWLVSLVRNVASPHQTAEYKKRLALIPVLANVPGGRVDANAPAEVFPPVRNADIQREIRNVRQGIVVIGEAQGQGPVLIPPEQLFRAVKIGQVWYTAFGTRIIAIGPRRRRAGLLAQAGNAFLRRLQRQSQVDPFTLEQTFEAYLRAASDPTSGIKPTLKIGL
jgi:hypothetical protein